MAVDAQRIAAMLEKAADYVERATEIMKDGVSDLDEDDERDAAEFVREMRETAAEARRP